MEIKQYTEIEETIKALELEFEPLFEEIRLFNQLINEVEEGIKGNPLLELIPRLTETSRRHNLTKKLDIDKGIVSGSSLGVETNTIGTNHNGLGYVEKWSSQLVPISRRNYTYNYMSEQRLRTILFDSEAVIELVSIIKKSKQKTFLKAVKILNNSKLNDSFGLFKKNNLRNIGLKFDDNRRLNIRIDKSIIRLNIEDLEGNQDFKVELWTNEKFKPHIYLTSEQNELLKPISKNRHTIKINDLKILFFLTNYSKVMINEIKLKRELVKGVMIRYKNEHTQLTNLLNPLLALEKL